MKVQACVLLSRLCVAACAREDWPFVFAFMEERDALYLKLDAFEVHEFMSIMRPDPRWLLERLHALETLARNLAVAGALCAAYDDGYNACSNAPGATL